jgi:hypothetical protein
MTTTIRLEMEDCRRCGGTGLHSFNRSHGSVCYGCAGRKIARTAEAKVASEKLKTLASELASVAAAELEPGAVIRENGRRKGWSEVVSVEPDELNVGRVHVFLSGNRHINYPGDTMLRRPMTDEEFAIYVETARQTAGVIVEQEEA